MITDVFHDLDNSLFVVESEVLLSGNCQNLERFEINFEGSTRPFVIYAINHHAIREIFLAMHKKGIRIHFITNGQYPRKEILFALTKIYELPKHFFDKSIFINRDDYPETGLKKPAKILLAQQEGRIQAKAKILAVDDHPSNITDFNQAGIECIHACGYPPNHYDVVPPVSIVRNNIYLQEMIDKCALGITLPEEMRVSVQERELIAKIAVLWDIPYVIYNFGRVANLKEIITALEAHRLDIENLKNPNPDGVTLRDISIANPGNLALRALMILAMAPTIPEQQLLIESHIKSMVVEMFDKLEQLRFDAAQELLDNACINARKLRAAGVATNWSTEVLEKYIVTTEKIRESRKIFVSNLTEDAPKYAQECLQGALHDKDFNGNKTLLVHEQQKLLAFLTQVFQLFWRKFDGVTADEIAGFIKDIKFEITSALHATSRRTRMYHWSNAGLSLANFDLLTISLRRKFEQYKRSSWPTPELPIANPFQTPRSDSCSSSSLSIAV